MPVFSSPAGLKEDACHRNGISWAHAASAPSRRSPEHAAPPAPPTPGCAAAAYNARPMSTEQLMAVMLCLARRVVASDTCNLGSTHEGASRGA